MQYHNLHIPHVGSFHVQYQPAVLHFADRQIHGPCIDIQFKPDETINTYAGSERLFYDITDQELADFGSRIKNHLTTNPFTWSSVGILTMRGSEIEFEPESNKPLDPVTAHKILRDKREHVILVGDREQSSADTSFITETPVKKNRLLWIGWVLLLLAALAIGWHLYYKGGFGSEVKSGTASIYPIR